MRIGVVQPHAAPKRMQQYLERYFTCCGTRLRTCKAQGWVQAELQNQNRDLLLRNQRGQKNVEKAMSLFPSIHAERKRKLTWKRFLT